MTILWPFQPHRRTRQPHAVAPVADPPSDPVYREAMPEVRPVPMAPHGSTRCMTGEICGTPHPLDGEHLVTAQPAIEWTSWRPVNAEAHRRGGT
jgi:hypothetical protein